MTYTDVNAILTDRDPAVMEKYRELVPMFERMHELFEILHARRRRRGSIDFDLPESEIVLDDAGLVEAVVASERNVAHRLIEEFMLLANETVAAHLEKVGMPALYRVHEIPDPMKVADLRGVHLDAGLLAGGRRAQTSSRVTSRSSSKRSRASRKRSRSRSSCSARCRRRGTTRPISGTSVWRPRPTRTSRRRFAGIPTSSCTACCANRDGAPMRNAAQN